MALLEYHMFADLSRIASPKFRKKLFFNETNVILLINNNSTHLGGYAIEVVGSPYERAFLNPPPILSMKGGKPVSIFLGGYRD